MILIQEESVRLTDKVSCFFEVLPLGNGRTRLHTDFCDSIAFIFS